WCVRAARPAQRHVAAPARHVRLDRGARLSGAARRHLRCAVATPPGRQAMSGSRSAILAAVAAATGARRAAGSTSAVTAHIRPARAEGGGDTLIARFCEMAAFAGATLDRVPEIAAIPAAVAGFVVREGLGGSLVLSPEAWIAALPWAD